MFCEKCGDKIEVNETYCNKCGNYLGNRQPLQQQQAQTQAAIIQQVPKQQVVQQQVQQQVQQPVQQIAQQMAQPTMPQVQQQPQQNVQFNQIVQQFCSPNTNNNVNNNNNNSNMFGNNVRSLNAQMMNMNYNKQPNTMSNQSLVNINYNHQTPQQPQRKKTKSVALGFVLGAFIFGILAFVILTTFQDSVYLSDNSYKEDTEEQGKKSSKTKTVIIYDNKYSGMNIASKQDAYKLIEKDSVDQKSTCPKEIIEIENNIIKNYGITAVNLCEMEAGFAKEVGNVFKNIYENYPDAKGYLTNLTLVNAPISSGYIAAFQPIFTFATSATDSTYPWVLKTQIYLNTSYFLNKPRLQSSVESGSSSGHFPPNATIYSPVAHEMGHYLSFLAMMNNYDIDSILLINDSDTDVLYQLIDDFAKGTFSLKMITEAYNNFKRDVGTTLNLDDWRATISSYAVAKDNSGNYIYDETIAESFHDVYLNGDKAAQASKYIVAVLKEKLKKGA